MLSQLPPWDPRESTTHRAASGQILPFRHSHPFVPLGGVVVTLRVTTSMRGRPQTAPEDAGSRAVQTSHPEPWSHHHNRRKCRPKILSSPLTVSFYPFRNRPFFITARLWNLQRTRICDQDPAPEPSFKKPPRWRAPLAAGTPYLGPQGIED